MAIVDEGFEDTYLISESRELKLKEAQRKSRVEYGNLALSKKEKKMKDKAAIPFALNALQPLS